MLGISIMNVYKSKIWKTILYHAIKIILISLYLLLFFAITQIRDSMFQFTILNIIIIGICLILIEIIYLSFTNNDVIISNDKIEFKGRLLFALKKSTFKVCEISHITMKHDWTETVLNNFKPNFLKYIIVEWVIKTFRDENSKWIKIQTTKSEFTFYCYGIEHNYYNNPKPCFEDLYFDFAKLNLDVEWTDTENAYYRDLKKEKESIVLDRL